MNVELIELPQDSPGFNKFIGAWVLNGTKNFLVDVGPANSVERLLASLQARNVNHIDYVLVTHIHIDHAGGLAKVLVRYPRAKVICHDKAIPLLVDPEKLWVGSLSVLGDVARMYGEPEPVSKNRLIPHTRCPLAGLRTIETPGHAAHHLSFLLDDRLFVGEAGGNYMALSDGTYLRPASPPRFFMEVFLSSLERLLALENLMICYGHFGNAPSSRDMLERFRAQLFRWKEIILAGMQKGEKNPVPLLMDTLLRKDPELALFHEMERDVQDRERFFLANSIRGFIGYLQNG